MAGRSSRRPSPTRSRSSRAWCCASPRRAGASALPFIHGRLFGSLPERGDVVIVTPPGTAQRLYQARHRPARRYAGGARRHRDPQRQAGAARAAALRADLPVDTNSPCSEPRLSRRASIRRPDGGDVCRLPIVTETLPNGRHYDTVELGSTAPATIIAQITIPANHVFLMGDNRDRSARQPLPARRSSASAGRCRRRISAGAPSSSPSASTATRRWNPLTWWGSLRVGPRRHLAPPGHGDSDDEPTRRRRGPGAQPQRAARSVRPRGTEARGGLARPRLRRSRWWCCWSSRC